MLISSDHRPDQSRYANYIVGIGGTYVLVIGYGAAPMLLSAILNYISSVSIKSNTSWS